MEILRELLEHGLASSYDRDLSTPLSLASSEGARRCVEHLLRCGASPDAGDPPPLIGAIRGRHHSVLEMLLDAGADPGSQPYHEDFESPLVVAAEVGDSRAIATLSRAGAVEASAPEYLREALQRALALRGVAGRETLLGMMEALLPRLARNGGADAELVKAARRLQSLARETQDPRSLELARRAKAAVDEGRAALEEAGDAVLEGRLPDLFDLLDGLAPDRRSTVAGMAAIYAAMSPAALVQSLITLGAATGLSDAAGRTALMYAVERCSHVLVEDLVRRGRASSLQTDDQGRTAFDWLERRTNQRFADVVKQYLEEATDATAPLARIDDAGAAAARGQQLVRDRQHSELFRWLRRLPAAERKVAAGSALLEECRAGGWTLLESLIESGADLNVASDGNSNVLREARALGAPKHVVERLIQLGARDPARP